MKAMRSIEQPEARQSASRSRPGVVYLQAPVCLGILLRKEEEGWRVRVGRDERVIPVDASVDPALIVEAFADGTRVVIDASHSPAIVGVIQKSRVLRISPDGAVEAKLERFSIEASKEAVIKTMSAFLQLKGGEVELYGLRLVSRAREAAKILARIIHLN